ncbi:uncharacterized protein [Nicotiana sylvestris]|uniref:uncharacterized protein n=1 Tax=Nicotiana sylvestris TaxID=4096 RepID=UPI00388C5742
MGASHGREDVLEDLFNGGDENIDHDAPVALEEAERLQQQAKKMYDHAFSRLQDKLSCCGKEIEKLTSELNVTSRVFNRQKDALVGEAAALSVAKSEAKENASSYMKYSTTANDRAREILEKDEQKLTQAISYARSKLRRQSFKEASAKGVDLSTEIEEGRTLEKEPAFLATSDEDFEDDLESSEAISWMPYEVPDLADWSQTLAACSTYDERIGEFFEIRPFPLREKEGSWALGSRTDNKCKESLKDEGAYSKASHARRLKEDVSADPAAFESSSLEKTVLPLSSSSFPIEGTSRDAFDKLKSELLHSEARLRKALDGEKSLWLLCVKRGKELRHLQYVANRSLNYESHLEKQRKIKDLEHLRAEVCRSKQECNELRAQIDAHIEAKKNDLAKVSTLEAEAEEIRAKANKKVAVYLKYVADDRAKLRGASDQESKSNEYDQCKPRRETLEEIHARGFDHSEENEHAKADEYDAKFLVSDVEDNEGEADGAAIPEGKVD